LGVEINALRGLCIWLLNQYGKFSRAEFTSRLEPIKFYKFPIRLTSRRLRFIIARTAKFLPHEQFALEFYYCLKFYAAARDLNFAATTGAKLHSISAKIYSAAKFVVRKQSSAARSINLASL